MKMNKQDIVEQYEEFIGLYNDLKHYIKSINSEDDKGEVTANVIPDGEF